MTTEPTITNWPHVKADVSASGHATVSIGGTSKEIHAEDLAAARTAVIAHVSQAATMFGRSLRSTMTDPDGQWALIIHPDGTVEQDDAPLESSSKPTLLPEDPTEANAQNEPEPGNHYTAQPLPQVQDEPHPDTWVRAAPQEEPDDSDDATYPTRRELRQSFLTHEHVEEPASQGWRGWLSRMGLRVPPSEYERAERDDIAAVSQHWPGPRTIAIANPKGGVGKTPTTVLLSAVFARYGGAGVLAWDNNQTRGTLGWRTEQGPHEATLLDLLPQVDSLLGTGAQSADLAHYVHHQTRDRFDVLRSKPTALAREQRVSPADVDEIHAVASKYYRLIFIDSGNDESDPMWLRMIDHADQLVVATTTRDDHAEAGALMLEALAERDEHSARLAADAVAVITQADPKAQRRDVERVAEGYQAFTRAAITIPFDQAMVDGILRYGSLHPTTQRAWLKAAAAVAKGL